MSEITATDHVHDLVDAGAISEAIADRLDNNGFETVADLLIANQEDLEDVPYVGAERAAEILTAVDGVDKPAPRPRDVDLEATESVVSEAAIPLAVRRGEAVLTKSSAYGTVDVFHTRGCPLVKTNDLVERDRSWADRRELSECQFCADPDARADNASEGDDPDPLVDSREVVLEASIGEKLQVTLADRDGWTTPRVVVATEEPTVWSGADGDTWRTRRIRLSTSATRRPDGSECDLVVGAEGVRIEDPPVQNHQPDAKEWGVESVGAVGRVSQSSYYQLVGQQTEQTADRPEGDDTYQKYQRGEA